MIVVIIAGSTVVVVVSCWLVYAEGGEERNRRDGGIEERGEPSSAHHRHHHHDHVFPHYRTLFHLHSRDLPWEVAAGGAGSCIAGRGGLVGCKDGIRGLILGRGCVGMARPMGECECGPVRS